jgi:hypothetical protein
MVNIEPVKACHFLKVFAIVQSRHDYREGMSIASAAPTRHFVSRQGRGPLLVGYSVKAHGEV